MTVDHKLFKHVLLQLPQKTVYGYCPRSTPKPVSKIFLIYFNRLRIYASSFQLVRLRYELIIFDSMLRPSAALLYNREIFCDFCGFDAFWS